MKEISVTVNICYSFGTLLVCYCHCQFIFAIMTHIVINSDIVIIVYVTDIATLSTSVTSIPIMDIHMSEYCNWYCSYYHCGC